MFKSRRRILMADVRAQRNAVKERQRTRTRTGSNTVGPALVSNPLAFDSTPPFEGQLSGISDCRSSLCVKWLMGSGLSGISRWDMVDMAQSSPLCALELAMWDHAVTARVQTASGREERPDFALRMQVDCYQGHVCPAQLPLSFGTLFMMSSYVTSQC